MDENVKTMNGEGLSRLRDSSVKIILDNQKDSGAYVASPNFPVYNYCWFRDGAFIADAMLVSGYQKSAEKFHAWASQVINARAEKIRNLVDRSRKGLDILPEEHLHCRFTSEGEESTEDWTNFQLDGFGTWLWSLDEYQNRGLKLSEEVIQAASLLIPYLVAFWREPSFDWWEESFGYQHVSTLVCIGSGLESCSKWARLPDDLRLLASSEAEQIRSYILNCGTKNGRLTKWIGSNDLDGSLAAAVSPLHYFQPGSPIANATLDAIVDELKMYGTYRHKNDVYFGGGSWLILSAFLGLGFADSGDLIKAKKILTWIADCANERGELPEQLNEHLLFPAFEGEWIEKWGEPALPLLWSHAMFLKLYVTIETLGGDRNVET